MAGCSSSYAISYLVILKNEVRCLEVDNRVGFMNAVKKGGLLLLSGSSRSGCFSRRKKHGFEVKYMLEPQAEPQSVLSPVTVPIEGNDGVAEKNDRVWESGYAPKTDSEGGGGNGNASDGSGKFPNGGGGGGGGDDGEQNDKEEEEFGPIMKFEEVIRETQALGATLPSDMLEAAKSVGLRKVLLLRYLDLQGSVWPLSFLMKSCSMLRNRMLADPSFLFKVGTEIVIDFCCATFAEVQKRGKDFWSEFELYLADLLVGMVVSVALVGILAPYARIGQPSVSKGFLGRMRQAYGALPSSVFEAERPGCKFSVNQRVATYFYQGFLYGSIGFTCGIIGQGIANTIMTAKRSIRKSEEDIPIPPLLQSAALWGVFLAVSSNTRYQIVNGLERLVEASPLAKNVPPVAMAFTVGVRFANNVYGGMQFVDWARWSGVQ
ncbi:protein RETICULATA, chloroplastic [Malania oleifera]|uniref:protein RETICULATA, chloroplastic n=1 Tax=Malania oleifera TaxID=397392 RepID=UPI0025AEADF2|nr:protein RETICULATA, chloroplastic [Malania oleifera]